MKSAAITFKAEKCRACELCIIACPKKIIAFDKDRINKLGFHPAWVKDQGSCTACAMCAVTCPHVVIKIENDK